MENKTWRDLILEQMRQRGESFENVVATTLCPGEIDLPNFALWKDFTIWTETRVYFPAAYEADLWCESVPRNPCNEKTQPVGG